jgi:hypothetical protein
MIAIELIIAAIVIGIIYKLKPVKDYSWWVITFLLCYICTDYIYVGRKIHNIESLELRKVEALEKLATEISKNKLEEK